MTINMTGKRFSSIVALNSMGKATSGDLKWLFACDCGNNKWPIEKALNKGELLCKR
jgi:hypothetical protein